MSIGQTILRNQLAKLLAGGLGAILAAIGGVTSIKALQPAVEKASDLAASAVEKYCELPRIDRERFHAEVSERLEAGAGAPTFATIIVTCPVDVQ